MQFKTKINTFVLEQIRLLIKLIKTIKAKIIRKKFYCNALSGNSDYNISINCDLSISCSCADHDGQDIIGDLNSQTIQGVFDGLVAKEFRDKLSKGKMPITQCATCSELRMIDTIGAKRYKKNYKMPKSLMMENTITCNYSCISCPRDLVKKHRKKKAMTLNDIRKCSSILKENKIENLYYFKLGETFSSSSIYNELRIIRDDNPDINIIISTNGALLNSQEKREAGLIANVLFFAMYGNNQKILSKYQKNGIFKQAYNNMKKLVDLRNERDVKTLKIEWKYVVFNWNDREHMLLEAIDLARAAGIDGISFWPTISPFWGWSWRYYFKLYSKKIKNSGNDKFFVEFK